jgi:hypothetical protein
MMILARRSTTTSLLFLSRTLRAKTGHRQNGVRQRLLLDRQTPAKMLVPQRQRHPVPILDMTLSMSRNTSLLLGSLSGQVGEATLPSSLRRDQPDCMRRPPTSVVVCWLPGKLSLDESNWIFVTRLACGSAMDRNSPDYHYPPLRSVSFSVDTLAHTAGVSHLFSSITFWLSSFALLLVHHFSLFLSFSLEVYTTFACGGNCNLGFVQLGWWLL